MEPQKRFAQTTARGAESTGSLKRWGGWSNKSNELNEALVSRWLILFSVDVVFVGGKEMSGFLSFFFEENPGGNVWGQRVRLVEHPIISRE